MAIKPETRIVRACLAFIGAIGGDGYHVHGSAEQRSGEPDIDAAIPRWRDGSGEWLHLKIEVKTPEGEPSNLQLYRLRRYAQMGYYTAIVHSVAQLKEAIAVFKETDQRSYGYE